VLVRGRTIYVANSGDSRAVIAERRGKEIVAVDLSIDQTPFRSDELERVKMCGARVLTLDQIEGLKDPDVQCWGTEEGDDGDPPRLWVPNGMYPGTAFTRSIGDSIAETIGVVANPEIVVFELTQDHPFFVLASDGVFEFLSSQSVVEMVWKISFIVVWLAFLLSQLYSYAKACIFFVSFFVVGICFYVCTKQVGGKVIISFQWQSRSGAINVSYCVSLMFRIRIGN